MLKILLKQLLMLKMLLPPHHSAVSFLFNGTKCLEMYRLGHLFLLDLVDAMFIKQSQYLAH